MMRLNNKLARAQEVLAKLKTKKIYLRFYDKMGLPKNA